ncbi:MAG TPA: hypothetical protein VNO51_16985 [Ilumatobacteraceae bacterium]|nr:hypothetical protein [Ilumatobacteraceae bacterium]
MIRGRGDRGSAMVTGVVLMFAFTAGAIIWLARDVDRAVSERASAQSIAFQAARSGAQQVDIEALRRGPSVPITIDPALARSAVESTVARLLDAYGLDGMVTTIGVAGDRVTVSLEVETAGRTVTGTGSARAQAAP